jgi:hypothetical protein
MSRGTYGFCASSRTQKGVSVRGWFVGERVAARRPAALLLGRTFERLVWFRKETGAREAPLSLAKPRQRKKRNRYFFFVDFLASGLV